MNPKLKELVSRLNAAQAFGDTELTEEQFLNIFSDEVKKEELLKRLNTAKAFGSEDLGIKEFNSTFFSSPSPEFVAPKAEAELEVSDRETRGYSTDLPDVQTESTVPELDPSLLTGTTDATADVDLSEIQGGTNIDRFILDNKDELFRNVSEYEGTEKYEVDRGSDAYQALYKQVKDYVQKKPVSARDTGVIFDPIEFRNDPNRYQENQIQAEMARFLEANAPEDIGLRDLQEQKFQETSEVVGLELDVTRKRLNELINEFENTPMTNAEADLKLQEIRALEDDLKEAGKEYLETTGIGETMEAFATVEPEEMESASKYLRGHQLAGGAAISKVLIDAFVKNQPKEPAIAELSANFAANAENVINGDEAQSKEAIDNIVAQFKANPYVREDETYVDRLSSVVAEMKLGRYAKTEAGNVLADMYVDAFRKNVEPKTKAAKIGYGITTIPYSIIDDVVEIAPELLTVAGTVMTQDDNRIQDAKQAVADAYESDNPTDIANAMQNFYDVESNVANEFLKTSGYLFDIDAAKGGVGDITKYKLDRSTAAKIKAQNRSLTDNTWKGIGDAYDAGEISKTEMIVGKAGVAISNAFQSSPSMVQAMIPYVGIASMATSAGADKYFEGLGNLDADYKNLLVGSAAVAVAEGFSGHIERYIGGKAWRTMTTAAKKKTVSELIKNSKDFFELSNSAYRKAVLKETGKDLGELLFDSSAEGFSEMLVTLTSNVVDRDVLGMDKDLFADMGETFATGFAMGAGAGSITAYGNIKESIKNPYEMSAEFREVYNAARVVQQRAKSSPIINKIRGRDTKETSLGNDVQGLQGKIEAIVLMTGASVSQATDALRATMPNVKTDTQLETDLSKAAEDTKQSISERLQEADARTRMSFAFNEMRDGNVHEAIEVLAAEEVAQEGRADETMEAPKVMERRAETADTAAMSSITGDSNQTGTVTTTLQSVSINGKEEDDVTTISTDAKEETSDIQFRDGEKQMSVSAVSSEIVNLEVTRKEDGTYTMVADDELNVNAKPFVYVALSKIAENMNKNGVTDTGSVKVVIEGVDQATIDNELNNISDALSEVFGEGGFTISNVKENSTTRETQGGQEFTISIDGGFNAQNVQDKLSTVIEFKEQFKEETGQDNIQEGETLEEYGKRRTKEAEMQYLTEEEAEEKAWGFWMLEGADRWMSNMNPDDALDQWRNRVAAKDGIIDETMSDEQILDSLETLFNNLLDAYTKKENLSRAMGKGVFAELVAIDRKKLEDNKETLKERYLKTIKAAVETQRESGGKFVFLLTKEAQDDYVNFWFGGDPSGHNSYGHFAPQRNAIVIYGDKLLEQIQNATEAYELSPLEFPIKLKEVLAHELFHSMLDKAYKAIMAKTGMDKIKIRSELVTQIVEMFDKGKLKFRSEIDQIRFAKFISAYREEGANVMYEEILVEIVPQIMQGKIFFDPTVEYGGLKKLLQTILDVVNDLFNTDFNIKDLGIDELDQRTVEAEAFLTILSSVYTPDEKGLSATALNGALVRLLTNVEAVAMAKMEKKGFTSEADYQNMIARSVLSEDSPLLSSGIIDRDPASRGTIVDPLGQVLLRIDDNETSNAVSPLDFNEPSSVNQHLSNHIMDALRTGAIKFKNKNVAESFTRWMGAYPVLSRSEEMVTEVYSMIQSGDLSIDTYRMTSPLKNMLKGFVRFASDISGTPIKLDFNNPAAVAEAFAALTEMGVTGSPSGLLADRLSSAKIEGSPIDGVLFQKQVKKTGFVAAEGAEGAALRKYALIKGLPTYEGKRHIAVEMTQEQAMTAMADLGIAGIHTDKGILTLDGKIYPKGKGGDIISINFGKNTVRLEYSKDPVKSGVKVDAKPYSPRIAREAVQAIPELKSDTEKKRLNKIAAKLMSLGYVDAAKSILVVAEATRHLKRNNIQTRIVFDKARKLRKDLAGTTLDINLKEGNPVKVATDMASLIFSNKTQKFKDEVYGAIKLAITGDKDGNAIKVLIDILSGTTELTDKQQQQLAKKIISTKNRLLKSLDVPLQIDESAVIINSIREDIFREAALELMSYGNQEFDDMVELGLPVGMLNTDKYTKVRDLDYNKPRTINPNMLAQRAEQMEMSYGLPKGSIQIPMFDHTTLDDDTPMLTVPHDRQFTGKVTTPIGDFDFSGGGLGMFHPDRVKAGVVYMSENSKVQGMVAQAIRLAKFIQERDGLPEPPNNVVVAAVMGKDNWQSNRDTAGFVTSMAEQQFGSTMDSPIPQAFKDAILNPELIKYTKDGVTKLSKAGRLITEIMAESKTMRDFFTKVEQRSFNDRKDIASRYFLQKNLDNEFATGKGSKYKRFLAKVGSALMGLSVEPAWNIVPDKHIFMMFEMDIAKTAKMIEQESAMNHRSYSTDVYGKQLGILSQTVFYPQAVSFPSDLLEATKPKEDSDMTKIIEAYSESVAKVEAGEATAKDYENITRMGREGGQSAFFTAGKEIPAPADSESAERTIATNVEADPTAGVRFMKEEDKEAEPTVEGVSPETTPVRATPKEGAKAAGDRLARDAKRKRKVKKLQELVASAKEQAIADLSTKSREIAVTLTNEEIDALVSILEGDDGYAITAFIITSDRQARDQQGMMFKADTIIAETLAQKLDISINSAKALVEAVTGRQFVSPESSTEARRREDYTQVVVNSIKFYMATNKLGVGFINSALRALGYNTGIEGIDTMVGDSGALMHRQIKNFAAAKRQSLQTRIKELERRMAILEREGGTDLAAMESLGSRISTAQVQLENLQQIIDDVDGYHALDKAKSVAAYTRSQMRQWLYEGGKKSFLARVNQHFTYDEFNEILLAMHTKERTVRNEQILRESIGLAQIERLELTNEKENIEANISKAEEAGVDTVALNKTLVTTERQLKENEEKLKELKKKLNENIVHAEDVLIPQSEAILKKFEAKSDEAKTAFRELAAEMKENLITKRIEMLYDNGMITSEQKEALMNGSRKSIDQINREGKDRELREQLDRGNITYDEYLEKQSKLDESSIEFEAQRELTQKIDELEQRYRQDEVTRRELDRALANGTIDAATHERQTASLLTKQQYETQLEFFLDAKENTVFKYDSFENYVPMQIDEDAYVNNVLEEAYNKYLKEKGINGKSYKEVNATIGSMFDTFTNELTQGDDSSAAFEHLSDVVSKSLELSKTEEGYRARQKRIGDVRRQIMGAMKREKRKSTKTGTGTTINAIRGNARFGLYEMVNPLEVLGAQFDLAAKIAARNEAKQKLVNLIEETNAMLMEEAMVAHNNGVVKIGKIVPTWRLRQATAKNMVEAAIEDKQLPKDVATSEQFTMNVYLDGQLHTIVFEQSEAGDQTGVRAMARAMLQDEASDFQSLNGGMLHRLYRSVMNYLRAAITTANIFFNASNLMRDTTESLMNISYIYDTYQESGKSKGAIAKEVAADMAEMMKLQTLMFASYVKINKFGLNAAEAVNITIPNPNGGTMEVSLHELIDMAKNAGAQMSWSLVNTDLLGDGVQAIQEAIREEVSRQKEASTFSGRMLQRAKLIGGLPIDLIKLNNPRKYSVPYYLSQMADALENHNRMAAFMLALKRGLTVDQAAAAARNVTVNFEKTGTLLKSAKLPNQSGVETTAKATLQLVQGAYLFIRPAVQGGRKFIQRWNTEKGRTSLAFSGLLSVMSNVFTVFMNYDEDETELKNIYRNKWAVENYFYVPLTKGAGLQIPKPYSPDKVLSTMITRSFGAKYTGHSMGDILWDGVSQSATLLLPLDVTRAGEGMFDPTILQPFMELSRNRTYTGRRPLRDPEDGINSVSNEMYLKTKFLGMEFDKNIWRELARLSRKVYTPETASFGDKLLSPQGIQHVMGEYFFNKGVLKPVEQVRKSFSEVEAEKFRQDNELTEGQIRLIQIGNALKYIKFDDGKVGMAKNFFNATKHPVKKGNFESKVAALQSIEDSFLAAKEIGKIDNKTAERIYKQRLTSWYIENSGLEGITEGLFKEVAPKAYRFMSKDLTEKQVQRILDEDFFRSGKAIEKLIASGLFDKLDRETQREMIREAKRKEKELTRMVKDLERSDELRYREMENIGNNAWWESFFGKD